MLESLRIWGKDSIDSNTLEQALRVARHPMLAGPVALMPDCHLGVGCTIGSVIPTENAIIPSCVGVDIGCGMIAVKTSLTAESLPDTLTPLVQQFGRSIPAGVGHNRKLDSLGASDMLTTGKALTWLAANPHQLSDKLAALAPQQLGTLGSGNHFVEVCLDEAGSVWVVLHSGSRGVGNQLAEHHIKLAKAQQQALEDPDLAYFLTDTPEFATYISDMLWAQAYALENRELMMDAALEDLFRLVGTGAERRRIQCHHNFAAQEMHGGKLLWITRKGAIRMEAGDYGVIPGSMATGSYIVSGLGNPASYSSASHGAGRRMSRGQARRTLTQESLVEAMSGKAWNEDAKGLLDEHPAAYKPIEQVMDDQRDLVKVVHILRQVVNYKGV